MDQPDPVSWDDREHDPRRPAISAAAHPSRRQRHQKRFHHHGRCPPPAGRGDSVSRTDISDCARERILILDGAWGTMLQRAVEPEVVLGQAGALTSGGISNVSFSFRGNNHVREAMHAVFLSHAIAAGLDMGIVNAGMLTVDTDLDPTLREAVEDVILARRPDAT